MHLLMPLAMFLLSLKSIRVLIIEEVNNFQCALIVSGKGYPQFNNAY